MPDQNTFARPLATSLALLVIARSAVFVFWPQSHFDSDQAVTGLMAKHIAELRAFPVFWYGQSYMLAVEAWLAAPVMLTVGPTVTALKIPLLAMNVAIALLLFHALRRDVHLAAGHAFFATLFFALAAPITVAHLLTANGGNVEPMLYVLLLWEISRRGDLTPRREGANVSDLRRRRHDATGSDLTPRRDDATGSDLTPRRDDATGSDLTPRRRDVTGSDLTPRRRGAVVTGAWLGIVLGIGFLNREFTLYGAVALVGLAAIQRRLLTRDVLVRFATMIAVAAGVWGAAQFAKQFSSAAGPGTSVSDLYQQMASNNLVEVARRICFDPRALAHGSLALLTDHFPQLYGTYVQPVVDFGVETGAWQGLHGASLVLGFIGAVAILRVASKSRRDVDPSRFAFCGYLLIASALSVAGYLAGRCGDVEFYTMRYELLSLVGGVGLAAWFLAVEPSRALRRAWMAAAAIVLAASAVAHGRIVAEYLAHPPVAAKQQLTAVLEARNVRYGYADFWTAYYVTFMSRERVILAANDAVRIRTYNRIVEQHPDAVLVSRRACPGGEQVTPAFWLCRP
jgi:hypothetical protein